jgi:hypothetical protein
LHIYFGTVVRTAPVREGGELVKLDWTGKRVEKRVPIVPDEPSVEHDPNPRGNTRGCRGIQIRGQQVLAANYHSVEIFDRDLNRQGRVTDGLMVGLHETSLDGDTLWVTSTAIDAAVGYDVERGVRTGAFFPRDSAALRQELALAPQTLDRQADHRLSFLDSAHTQHGSHLHLNAVAQWQGRHYALCHAKGAIVDLSRETVVYRDPALIKAHNLVVREDGLAFVNDTYRATLKIIDLGRGRLVKSLPLRRLGAVQWILAKTVARTVVKLGASLAGKPRSHIARPLFLRGLAVSGSKAWLGFSPATIVCLDWEEGRLVDLYQDSGDVRVCVHGLALAD